MTTYIEHRRGGSRGRWIIALLLLALIGLLGSSAALFASTARVRYERDVTRMVFNDNLELLDEVRNVVGFSHDTLDMLLSSAASDPSPDVPYIVISITENKLWYKHGDSVLMETQVATGSGKTLVTEGQTSHWKFDTPRGRLFVERKDINPSWVPPDWHYIEQARKRGVSAEKLNRGDPIDLSNGSQVTVSGSNVVLRRSDGSQSVLNASDGREIVVDGKMIIPPFGTNQRKYNGVLGTRRLYLGDGYGIHGTNDPSSIGRSVSHGCVRMRNEDIERLFEMVPLGTPVYIY